MEEQLISFETAKLAKEKGYGGKGLTTSYGYYRDGILCSIPTNNKSDFCGEDEYSAPTQSLLQKWLREEHNIIIVPNYIYVSCGADQYGPLCDVLKYDVDEICMKVDGYFITISSTSKMFDTYEEALEAGLQEALKLIK